MRYGICRCLSKEKRKEFGGGRQLEVGQLAVLPWSIGHCVDDRGLWECGGRAECKRVEETNKIEVLTTVTAKGGRLRMNGRLEGDARSAVNVRTQYQKAHCEGQKGGTSLHFDLYT